jgi:mannose/fructose/N-acetylgalactosamine-specific phosphotransferase system component IID
MAAKMPETRKIQQSDLDRAWWIWTFFNLSAFSMERMQAPAFVYMMSPILTRLYGDNPNEIKAALKRHMVFFNTEPQTGVIAHGVAASLEEQRANGEPITDEMINGAKAGIMGPMAGIGDSMIPGTLIPILLSIGIGISKADGNPIGPIFYIVAFLTIILVLSRYLFMFGYRYGMGAMRQLAEGSFQRITHSLAVLGLVVAGGVGAGLITLTTPLQLTSGDTVLFKIQDKLDAIFPQLLALALVLWLWNGMRRRGWPINRALVMTFVVVIVGFLPYLIGYLLNSPFLMSLRIF